MTGFIPAAVKPSVGIDILESLDIRVGTIERVEDVPHSEKLMKLIVNFGDHTRQILAGIKAERPNPDELRGRQALFVVNLSARKMAGQFPKACCLISATPMASLQCSQYRSAPCQTARVQVN